MDDLASQSVHDDLGVEKTLADVTELLRRGAAPSYVSSGNVWVIGQRCVQNDGFQAEAAQRHDSSLLSKSLTVRRGDVLLNSTGSGTIGRSCVFDAAGTYVVDSHITLLRPRRDLVEPGWLNLILRSPWGQRHLETHCFAGSTSQVDLSELKYCQSLVPQRLELRHGDVLFNRTNSIEHIGKSCVWRNEITQATFASYMVRINPITSLS